MTGSLKIQGNFVSVIQLQCVMGWPLGTWNESSIYRDILWTPSFRWNLFCSNLKWHCIGWCPNCWSCEQDPVMWPFKWNPFSGTITWYYHSIWYEDVTFELVNKILRSYHSNETLSVVLSHSTVSSQVYKKKIKILVHMPSFKKTQYYIKIVANYYYTLGVSVTKTSNTSKEFYFKLFSA